MAAGAGRRMAGADKVMALLEGRPVLAWAMASLAAAESVRRIVVVAAPERRDALAAEAWMATTNATVVAGGPRRQDSVLHGVQATDATVVLVHDAARPFVSAAVVDAVAQAARDHGAAIPVVPVSDSLKRVDSGTAFAVEREGLLRAQTPQGAQRELLVEAFRTMGTSDRTFGDEAALLEAAGVSVMAVPGDPANLKITEPADLEMARVIAAGRGAIRYGSAVDTHPFGPRDGLVLGGVTMPQAPRLHGHSDGDVVLHAIADAMLGAAALPDLGRRFPPSDPQTADIDSARLLSSVAEAVAVAGWRAASVDVTILGARPRLGGTRMDEMRSVIARLVGLPAGQVAVKASTGNLSGPEGAGSVITASVLVGLARR